MRKIYVILLLLFCVPVSAQELMCQITINTQQVNQTNQQVFKTLEKSLQEFVNRTQWTEIKVLPNEKIRCAFIFTIKSYENNKLLADIQIQSTRPVYGSVYQTTIFNHLEKNISFGYLENEPLYFTPDVFTSELSSLIAYYANIIIGLDADTFAIKGGEKYFRKGQSIVLNAQTSPDKAWQQTGENNRWQLVSDLLSNEYEPFHQVLYTYHREGLDKLANEPIKARDTIKQAILQLEKIKQGRLNQFLIQMFFDAKADEIVQIFSQQNNTRNVGELKSVLEKIAPVQSNKWQEIR